MNNEIGGYFELELQDNKTVFHDEAIEVNSGRNALEYILLSNDSYKKIFIPYYTCDVILQPIKRLKYEFEFYTLNSNLTPEVKALKNNEVLIFINYFGIMNKKIKSITKKFRNVIIDNSHAFFAKPLNNVPTFYSPRKFFGLPDGGFAYTNKGIEINLERDKSINRFEHLLKRWEDGAVAGFNLFRQNEAKLDNLPLRKMSIITERLLRNINFKNALKRRNENFLFLHNHLKDLNELTPIIENEKINGPMVYPFLSQGNKRIKKHLIKNKIYVATYWPNVLDWLDDKTSFEHYCTNKLIPLPISQNLSKDELKIIIKKIKQILRTF